MRAEVGEGAEAEVGRELGRAGIEGGSWAGGERK